MYKCQIQYRDGSEKAFLCHIWEAENGIISFGCGPAKFPWSVTFNVPLAIIDSYTVTKMPATRKGGLI